MMPRMIKIALAAACVLAAVPNEAATLLYSISADYTASFTLETPLTPSVFDEGESFDLFHVPFAGSPSGVAEVRLWNSAESGGLRIEDVTSAIPSVLFDTAGPQLYSGVESARTLLTGVFDLTDYDGPGSYTLTVTDVSLAVAEPATWAMMILGFGIAGAAMRRRQRVTVSYA